MYFYVKLVDVSNYNYLHKTKKMMSLLFAAYIFIALLIYSNVLKISQNLQASITPLCVIMTKDKPPVLIRVLLDWSVDFLYIFLLFLKVLIMLANSHIFLLMDMKRFPKSSLFVCHYHLF